MKVKLFLGPLPTDLETATLRQTLEQHGPLHDCVVKRNPCSAYAFVVTEPRVAAAIIDAGPHVAAEGVKIPRATVARNQRRAEPPQVVPNRLYVGDVPHSATDLDLLLCFGRHGEVSSAVLIRGREGPHRGFGFVTFAQPHSVEAALRAASAASGGGDGDTRPPCLHGKRLDVRRALARSAVCWSAPPPVDCMYEPHAAHWQPTGAVRLWK